MADTAREYEDMSFKRDDGKTIEIRPIGTPIRKADDLKISSNEPSVTGSLQKPEDVQKQFSADTAGPPKPPETTALSTVDWESMPDDAKVEEGLKQLALLGFQEEELSKAKIAFEEAKVFLEKDTRLAATSTETESLEKNKEEFKVRDVAAASLFMLVDLVVNNGQGTTRLLEQVMAHYLNDKIVPGFLTTLGIDEDTIQELHRRRHDIGRAFFQMDRPNLLRFISNFSKQEAFDCLKSLDEQELHLLITEGSIGERKGVLTLDEVKKHLIDKLTEEQKQKLRIPIEGNSH